MLRRFLAFRLAKPRLEASPRIVDVSRLRIDGFAMCSHGLDDDGVDDEEDGDWFIVSNDDDDDDDYLGGARYGGIDGGRGWEIVKCQEMICELPHTESSADADVHADLRAPYEDEDTRMRRRSCYRSRPRVEKGS
ncbi:uncharacterized protein Z519_07796 [Cladophialophora bantiana CBS 173.52]|uniref:Uncharacterized protein n=1 Tax=Cladophialophora bantiana (strain ATCC 10958 / CBS 173.52 / CDC B-1940 / NIH 8579) TaxID=1442370 RepID=A0A0D2EPB8_CLAB1|nr:uncharacterized protein Z519_07796 [Cladophialophora bantiana CBS 173.52]KIW91826.1 hypothetical protein Z519_07796 [Cladophialophora bantiana CBS 173.52]